MFLDSRWMFFFKSSKIKHGSLRFGTELSTRKAENGIGGNKPLMMQKGEVTASNVSN